MDVSLIADTVSIVENLPAALSSESGGGPGRDRKLTGIPVVSERSMGFSAVVMVVVCLVAEGAVMVAVGEGGISINSKGHNWDEPSWWFSSRSSGFAYGFVYEVIYWIALSNCVHFAFKKVVRIVADGIGDTERGKAVPLRLTTMC
ncbi:hypothetical protein OIU76_010838 [Salix suchowensis]|nr:hypothetical protein OIU76_010838 [Salix suchowensis]